jgi:hypothetical protein
MGVSVRMSRNTRAYVPFWAAALFWLVAGPIVLAGWLIWALAQIAVAVVRAIQEHRQAVSH